MYNLCGSNLLRLKNISTHHNKYIQVRTTSPTSQVIPALPLICLDDRIALRDQRFLKAYILSVLILAHAIMLLRSIFQVGIARRAKNQSLWNVPYQNPLCTLRLYLQLPSSRETSLVASITVSKWYKEPRRPTNGSVLTKQA